MRGSLPLYVSEFAKQTMVEYYTVYPNTLLSQASATRLQVPFHVEGLEGILKGLLEIGIITPRLSVYNIILVFNGVTLTRELKPSACINIDGRNYCKLVFDVTPIITYKSHPPLFLDVEYHGVGEVSIAHAGLIMVKKSDEATSSSVLFYSGSLLLDVGDTYTLKLQHQGSDSRIARFIVFVPHPNAVIRISCDGRSAKQLEISGVSGFNEYTMSIGDASELRIEYIGDKSYYPRTLLVSSLVIHDSPKSKPLLDLVVKELKGEEALVSIANNGLSEARNVIVTSISRGIILDRKLIDRLRPGQEKELTIRIDPSFSSIRVIWRHLDKTEFREIRIRNGVILGKDN